MSAEDPNTELNYLIRDSIAFKLYHKDTGQEFDHTPEVLYAAACAIVYAYFWSTEHLDPMQLAEDALTPDRDYPDEDAPRPPWEPLTH